jgi:predicted ABC-type transport system involved in lysophospholipase L1 biosynthesis ATPase subunit
MCNSPDIIFADEPTGNLDDETSLGIQQVLLDCVERHNKALVVVTHDTSFAHRCHTTYRLDSGTLINSDTHQF